MVLVLVALPVAFNQAKGKGAIQASIHFPKQATNLVPWKGLARILVPNPAWRRFHRKTPLLRGEKNNAAAYAIGGAPQDSVSQLRPHPDCTGRWARHQSRHMDFLNHRDEIDMDLCHC
jgi:hypothetical protein